MSKADTVLRVRRNREYSTISLLGVHDSELSWKATGIHTYLISRPDGWKFNIRDLTQRKKDGKASVESALQELQERGYLRIQRPRGRRGRITGALWTVSEHPMPAEEQEEISPQPGNRVMEGNAPAKMTTTRFPSAGKPGSGESAPSKLHEGSRLHDGSSSVSSLRSSTGEGSPSSFPQSDGKAQPEPIGHTLTAMLGGPLPRGKPFLVSDDPPSSLHLQRIGLVPAVRKYAWRGEEPPGGASCRSHEMKILGELLSWPGVSVEEIRGVLEVAHDAVERPFRLTLLVWSGGRLFREFSDRWYKRSTGPIPAPVLAAISAALTDQPTPSETRVIPAEIVQ